MTDKTITVTVEIHHANYESERAVLLEAIDALTYYSCTLPERRLQPWIKEITIT